MAHCAPQALPAHAPQLVPEPGRRHLPEPSHWYATAVIGQGTPGAHGSQTSPQAFPAQGSKHAVPVPAARHFPVASQALTTAVSTQSGSPGAQSWQASPQAFPWQGSYGGEVPAVPHPPRGEAATAASTSASASLI